MSDPFGWDLMYKVSERDLNKKEDVLTLIIHYILIKNGYRCIGLGEDKQLSGNENGSEILPDNWNAAKNYSIRYLKENELYILRALPVDDNMIFNLLKVSNLALSNVAFRIDTTISATRGPLSTMVPTSQAVFDKIKTELLDPMMSSTNKEATTQTAGTAASKAPHRPPDPSIPYGIPPMRGPEVNPFWTDPDRDPLRVGGRDLDPFGVGGGMIFNPFHPSRGIPDPDAGIPGGLPRGAIPPGARFDPFAPPGAGRFPRPPPDSDFGSGMFM